MKKGLLITLGVIVALIFMVVSTVIGTRNRLVTFDENITAQWSEVDNQMQRRADLIPNLVNTVKGFAKHESGILMALAEARARMAGAKTIPEKISANDNLGSALARLLVVVENYPQLKADKNFIALQDELSGTENRIAVARRTYNESVQSFNTLVRSFPGNVIGSMFGFTKKDTYFQANEGAKAVPQVQF